MKEEKVLILSMLEQGKITSEEAMRLLESLEDEKATHREYNFNSFEDIGSDIKDAVSKIDVTEIKENIKASVSSIDKEYMKSDLKNSISSMVQNLFGMGIGFGDYSQTKKTTVDIDFKGIETPNLNFSAINGSIIIKSYESDKIIVDVTTKFRDSSFKDEELFIVSNTANEISLYPKYDNNNISISLNILVPNKLYNTIKLFTKNSSIECRDLNFSQLSAITKNSSIYLMNLKGNEIEAKTSNSKITLNDIVSKTLIAKTSNSSIKAESIDSEILYLNTSNSKIETKEINLSALKEITLETSNSSIVSELENIKRPIYFDLSTSNGSININNPSNLVYSNLKSKNKISAYTTDFDATKEHIKFVASTSNGSIKII